MLVNDTPARYHSCPGARLEPRPHHFGFAGDRVVAHRQRDRDETVRLHRRWREHLRACQRNIDELSRRAVDLDIDFLLELNALRGTAKLFGLGRPHPLPARAATCAGSAGGACFLVAARRRTTVELELRGLGARLRVAQRQLEPANAVLDRELPLLFFW